MLRCLSEKVKDMIVNSKDKMDGSWKGLDEKYRDPSKLADMVIKDVRKENASEEILRP